jgi:hypothetical protein
MIYEERIGPDKLKHYVCTFCLSFPRRRESTLAEKMDTCLRGYDNFSHTRFSANKVLKMN